MGSYRLFLYKGYNNGYVESYKSESWKTAVSLLRAGIVLCNFHVLSFILAQCLQNICRLSELILTYSSILQMKTAK